MVETEISRDKLFSTLFQNTQDGIVICDFSFRIIDMNPCMEEISGYSKEEVLGRKIEEFVPRDDYEWLHDHLQQAKVFSNGKVHRTRVSHKSGATRIVETSEVVVPLNEEKVILSIMRDVTEYHETRQALEKQKQYSEGILKSLPCIYFFVEIEDKIPRLAKWNQNFQTEMKMTPEELQNINILDFFNKKEQEIIKKEIDLLLEDKNHFFTHVFNPILGDGSVVRYYYQCVPFYSDNKTFYLGTGLDISEKRDLERLLIESVIQTEESERRRISSDLHDGLGAELSTIKLYIQGFLDAEEDTNQKSIGGKLLNLVDDAVDSISDIAFNISPNILLEYGLVAAVEAFIAKLRTQRKLSISFTYDEFDRFDINEEVTLYRTITELINNTLKHAGAEMIRLGVRLAEDHLVITYSDNGYGFDLDEAMSNQARLGLRNMKSRIESLGGKFKITTSLRSGMKAQITLPYRKKNG